MSAKSTKSAVDRTVPMALVDLREQHDGNALDLRGTPLVRFVLIPSGPGVKATHLAVIGTTKPLCGAKGSPATNEPVGQSVCAACRVAAADRELGDLGGVVHR